MKNRIKKIWPYLGIVIGLVIVGYYPMAELYDSWRRSRIQTDLQRQAEELPSEKLDELKKQARAYNQVLAGETPDLDPEQILPYDEQLSIDGTDSAFASLMIPAIDLTIPVYHGTEEATLMAGAGHLKGTSLPVGGESTHTVLSAHTGMSRMRGFDELDQVKTGDIFGIRTLDDIYAYKVDSIEVVLPTEMESLKILPGEDRATLVTCVPYGINDHRLLVHASRTEVPDGYFDAKNNTGAVLKSRRVWPFLLALAAVGILLTALAVRRKRKRKRNKEKGQEKN